MHALLLPMLRESIYLRLLRLHIVLPYGHLLPMRRLLQGCLLLLNQLVPVDFDELLVHMEVLR